MSDKSEIRIFKSPQFGEIRTAGTSEAPLFCLADVCRVLDLQTGATKNRLDEKGVSLINTPTNGGVQQLVYINEKNLYKVIMRSDKPQAEPFQDWVCGEVLPSIRKTGSYSVKQKLPQTYLEALKELVKSEEEKQQLVLENKKQQQQIEEAKPAITFTNAFSGAESSCLIGELAKIIAQNGYPIGEKRLFKWMRDNGYLGKHGERYNIPNQQYIEQGLFALKKGVRSGSNGVLHTTITTKVTGKGTVYFVNKFLNGTDRDKEAC